MGSVGTLGKYCLPVLYTTGNIYDNEIYDPRINMKPTVIAGALSAIECHTPWLLNELLSCILAAGGIAFFQRLL